MIDEKGLDPSIADAIGEYVQHNGGIEVLEKMETDEKLGSNKSGKAGIEDMKLLLQYCKLLGILDKVLNHFLDTCATNLKPKRFLTRIGPWTARIKLLSICLR